MTAVEDLEDRCQSGEEPMGGSGCLLVMLTMYEHCQEEQLSDQKGAFGEHMVETLARVVVALNKNGRCASDFSMEKFVHLAPLCEQHPFRGLKTEVYHWIQEFEFGVDDA